MATLFQFHLAEYTHRLTIAGRYFYVLPQHTQLVATMAFPAIGGTQHRDPFDRLLIAQAIEGGMSIISDDAKFSAYPIPIIW